MNITLPLLLALTLTGSSAITPQNSRPELPDFETLEGPDLEDRLSKEDVHGAITILNLWYEW